MDTAVKVRCEARVFDNKRYGWAAHQCHYAATSERTVAVVNGQPRRIPVCRVHSKQRRDDFAEYR